MPTLVVGMRFAEKSHNMPTASVGMAPINSEATSITMSNSLLCSKRNIAVTRSRILICAGLAIVLSLSGCTNSAGKGKSPPLTSAREVLKSMVAAYQKADSYADGGTVRFTAEVGEQKVDDAANFSVTLRRPNKARLHVYTGVVVTDGDQFHAWLEDMPDQVLAKNAPAKLSLESLYSDEILSAVMNGGAAGPSLPLVLLLEKDPLAEILKGAAEPALGESGEIDGNKCYRVEVKWPHGTGVFWIDRESFVLRRCVYPTLDLVRKMSAQGTVKKVSVVADFTGARLDGPIEPEAFQCELPPGAEMVKYLVEPNPAQLLSKKIRDFKLADLEGNAFTRESLADRITVLNFWSTTSPPCRETLSQLNKVAGIYKDQPKIIFLAVSVDQPEVESKNLIETLGKYGVALPILRDQEQYAQRAFRIGGVPSTLILDKRGVVQDFDVGVNPDFVDQLTQKLQKLSAGENIYHKPLQKYRNELARMDKFRTPKAAERTEPAALKLTSLWRCGELKEPGPILIVDDPRGKPRLLAVNDWRTVAEVGLDGRIVATHPLDLDATQQERVAVLRSAAAADGKRYYLAFAPQQQRVHAFDADWKKIFSYPQDAADNPRDVVIDADIGDMDGDGEPEIYISYMDVAGVRSVSLRGKPLYSNRTVINARRAFILEDKIQTNRRLVCAATNNKSGVLLMLDDKLERQNDFILPDRSIIWAYAADLAHNGNPYWCALTASQLGENQIFGLDSKGMYTWNYTMPEGVHEAFEPIASGNLIDSRTDQWLLAGVDGSIHILSADGKPTDRFNYGALLRGLAAVAIDGRPALLVSSSQGIEALRVEEKKR
jgi:thiol-disulfide isomerase/thioredoxin